MRLPSLRAALSPLPAMLIAAPAMAATTFPEGATSPTADEIRQRLSDKVFDVKLDNGTAWRLEFKANGYYFVDVSTGGKANGEWKADNAKLCSKPPMQPQSCNEVRLHDDHLYLQRTNGEVIRYVPRP